VSLNVPSLAHYVDIRSFFVYSLFLSVFVFIVQY